jgi:hypothetical protein
LFEPDLIEKTKYPHHLPGRGSFEELSDITFLSSGNA